MQRLEQRASGIIGAVSFVCALLVVFIHADVNPTSGSWQATAMQIVRYLNKVAVPYFFLFSGYFLAGKLSDAGWYRQAVRKRVFSLMVPFYLWMLLYQLLNMFLVWLAGRFGLSLGAETFALTGGNAFYLLGLHPFKLVPIIWYLRSLFLLVLISPILANRCRRGLMCVCVVAYALWSFHEMSPWRGLNVWLFFEYFFSARGLCFFSIGIFIRKYGQDFTLNGIARGTALVISIAGIAIAVAMQLSLYNLIPFLMVPMMLSVWCIVAWLVDRGLNLERMQKYCMAVYLMHMPWLIVMAGISTVAGVKTFFLTSIGAFAVKSALAVVSSIACVHLMGNRISKILLGGRA